MGGGAIHSVDMGGGAIHSVDMGGGAIHSVDMDGGAIHSVDMGGGALDDDRDCNLESACSQLHTLQSCTRMHARTCTHACTDALTRDYHL